MRNSVQHSKSTLSASMLDSKDFDAIRNLLRKDIPTNLFMISWLENYGVFTPGRRDLFEWVGVFDEQLRSVALLINKRLLMFSASSNQDLTILAAHFSQYKEKVDHIVAEASEVDSFWDHYSKTCPPPRLERDQKFLTLRRDKLESHDSSQCNLRLAKEEDLDAVFFASAAMHVEESLENPLESDPIMFRRHVQRRIQTERTYVWIDKIGRLVFKADISAQCSFGSQISGIYVPPSMRRKGYGKLAVAELCKQLFAQGSPLLTLYVNTENLPARALYQKVGFQEHCEFKTVFVV